MRRKRAASRQPPATHLHDATCSEHARSRRPAAAELGLDNGAKVAERSPVRIQPTQAREIDINGVVRVALVDPDRLDLDSQHPARRLVLGRDLGSLEVWKRPVQRELIAVGQPADDLGLATEPHCAGGGASAPRDRHGSGRLHTLEDGIRQTIQRKDEAGPARGFARDQRAAVGIREGGRASARPVRPTPPTRPAARRPRPGRDARRWTSGR